MFPFLKSLIHPAARNRCWVAAAAVSALRAELKGARSFDLDGMPCAYLDIEGVFSMLLEIGLVDIYGIGIGPGDAGLIIDCGSNIGLAARCFARRNPRARLLCFEPSAAAFAALQSNLSCLGRRGAAFNVALGDREDSVDLYRDVGFSMNMRLGSPGACSSREKVQMARLSNYFNEPVDLLKVDVEGSEFGIFADLERSGKIRLVRNIVIEADWNQPQQSYHLPELLGLLEHNGFGFNLKAGGSYWVPSRIGEYQTVFIYAARSPAPEAAPRAGCNRRCT